MTVAETIRYMYRAWKFRNVPVIGKNEQPMKGEGGDFARSMYVKGWQSCVEAAKKEVHKRAKEAVE